MVKLESFLSSVALFSLANAAAILMPRDCTFTWAAEKGDTCQTMASDWGISLEQFTQWNVGVNCAALVVGKEYCLLWEGPLPTATTTTTTTTTSKTTTTTTTTPSTTTTSSSAASATTTTSKTTTTTPSTTTTTTTPSATTTTTTTTTTLKTTTTTTTTTITTTTTTGVPQPTPVQAGIAANCQKWHLVKSGNTCQIIVDTYKTFTLAEFYTWNPAVGSTCASLWVNYYVCIAVPGTPTTPSPTQAGINPSCKNWYMVVSGDYCQKIADQFKITLAQFYAWNPAVGTTCASLWLGYYVCVA